MAAIARDSSRFAGVKTFSEKFSQPEVDAEGRVKKVETREDEEQNVKMAETVELLLAAGYFRARIKGLSPFDKVVGGMTWCISVCDFDVDVDLLFPRKFNHWTKDDFEFIARKPKCINGMKGLKETYKPHRRYRKPESTTQTDEETRVRTTLLEYGWQYGFSKEQRDKEKEQAEKKKAAAVPGRMRKASTGEEDEYVVEQKRLKSLLKGMSVMEGREQAELLEDMEVRGERMGGVQTHKRMVTSLEKQIAVQEKKLEQVQEKHNKLQETLSAAEEQLSQAAARGERIGEEMDKFNQMESGENASILQKLRSIVVMNENLKKQEQQFRAHCKEEMTRLQENLEKLKVQGSEDDSEEKERLELIGKQYEADKAKLEKIRLLLARKNREISSLQRKIDEVPSRAELTQYQRRFVELYNHVAGTHKETKQFFTLYNTLDDTKLYLGKEVNLLNSIHDNFEQAMSSPSNKEQFLKQFDSIIKGIMDNKGRIEKKKGVEKLRRDGLNQKYLDIVEQERLYYKNS
ncbi:Coiled-coil domain-containing protein 93 [Desmophyllum pertusum]|uniref:Coiled-coil domain-containing protein 93 n=1 Tax=Desmophyllum pertusum TaxID=174260 RepID=A0A9W9YJX4_9CNID|nr:Coiled-coil domain-containing protein 93 [Desmophyllum pertusum]